MKLRLYILSALFATLFAAAPAHSTTAYAYCGANGAYVMLYQSVDQLEILGHLRCNDKVEILSRVEEYVQIRTQDGRVGWVHYSELSAPAGPAPTTNSSPAQPNIHHAAHAVAPLTNMNIMKMHVMKLSSDVIVAKIQASPCEFDTSPAALEKLKKAGLPDKVILAMVQVPSASAPPAPKKPEFVEVKVANGTPIEVELGVRMSSDSSQDAMIVPMKVTQDVVVNGVTVFQHGAEARAQVTTLKQPGFMNRPPGEISWTMDYVTAVTGEHVSATFFSTADATNPMSQVMGASGPSWEFRKGKPVIVAAGQRFDAAVHGDVVVKIPQSTIALQASSAQDGQSSAQATPGTEQSPTKP